MLPGVVFVVMFVITSDLHLTIGVSAALAVLQVIVRLCQRQSVMGAVSGLLAVGICLIWAWNSHEARNYYMFGFLTNAFYIVLLAISLMVRVPGLGSDRIHPDTANRASARMACRLAWRQGIEPRVHHHHRVVDRCVLTATGGAGAVVPVQPGRLARHCTSAHGHSVLGVGHLGVVPHRGHPMHRHKTLAEPNADAMDDNNETEEQH